MKIKYSIYLLLEAFVMGFLGLKVVKKPNFNSNYTIDQKIDSLNGVYVYYKGMMDNVSGRNTTPDGYNLSLKYQ